MDYATRLSMKRFFVPERGEKAGARFFFALANHHDGFDCWDSKHQPWNAQRIGPHRDVVGT